MQAIPRQPRRAGRLARALGFDGNPLRRATDRAEAWIRVGLLAVFLIAGPLAALGAGHWAYHAGITRAPMQAAQAHRVTAVPTQPALPAADLARAYAGSRAWASLQGKDADASARSGGVLAAVMTLAFLALALLAALRLARAFLSRRRLAAWETAWSKVGSQWTGGRS
jgi:hypothetical protein